MAEISSNPSLDGLLLFLFLLEPLGVFLVGDLLVVLDLPLVGGDEGVGGVELFHGLFHEVTFGPGVTARAGENILDTLVSHHLLHGGGTDDTGTPGGGHEPDLDGTALTGNLHGDGVLLTEFLTPVTPPDGHKPELLVNNLTLDLGLDFLTDLVTETDVTVVVTDEAVSDEPVVLTLGGHLLDGVDLGHFILEDVLVEEVVDDLVLSDGKRMQIDLFDGFDLALSYQPAELGHGGPGLVTTLFTLLTVTFLTTFLTTLLTETTFTETAVTHVC